VEELIAPFRDRIHLRRGVTQVVATTACHRHRSERQQQSFDR